MTDSFTKMTEDEIVAICAMRTRGTPIAEIAAHFGRSYSGVSYQLGLRGVRLVSHSAHVEGVAGEAFADATDKLRMRHESAACDAHLADLEAVYPDGPPWQARPASHEARRLIVPTRTPFSMVGSPAAMCEG